MGRNLEDLPQVVCTNLYTHDILLTKILLLWIWADPLVQRSERLQLTKSMAIELAPYNTQVTRLRARMD
jgi:hypothetical protein